MTKPTKEPKRVALYLRVSTNGQTTANQRKDLEEIASRHGWKIVAASRMLASPVPRGARSGLA
jgi:DNA invertase Pin-like site-specific DNA recombinase